MAFNSGVYAQDGSYRVTTVGTSSAASAPGSVAGSLLIAGTAGEVITNSHIITDSDGAQTNFALLTVAATLRIVITQISVKMDATNTTNVTVRIGFGATTVPAAGASGAAAAGVILEGQFAANGGQQVGHGSGIVGIGAAGEDLRITSGDPVSGNIRVTYSYYIITP